MTGLDTIYCVEAAIRSGFDLGYKIVVPADLVACNASNEDLHNNTLKLTNKVFGVTATAQEIKNIWQQ